MGSRACSQVSSELTSEHHPHEEERRGRGRGEERKKRRILILEFSIRQPKERRREEKRGQERGQEGGKKEKRKNSRSISPTRLGDWEGERKRRKEESEVFLSSVNLNSSLLEGPFACFFGFLLLSYALLSLLPSLLSSPVLGDEYKEQYYYPILP